MRWFRRFSGWLRFIVDTRRPLQVECVDESPDVVDAGKLYLVGDPALPWSAVFSCPCGCKETIALSLIRDDSPRWRVRRHIDGTVSLSPSIWRIRGCESHFYVRRGKIVWAVVDGPVPRRVRNRFSR
jgi:hypothetical protein